MRDRVVYPSWEPAASRPLSTRSYFYSLQPLQVGSPRVESLTSYVTRLAEAHDVSPGILLSRELIPTVREAFHRHAYRNREPDSTFIYRSYTLNGVGQRAQDWVTALENLTGIRSLKTLTMTPWSPVISERGLIRPRRAWCPRCYEDWRDLGQPVYEPLLWSIREVSICPTHEISLKDRCPHCNQQLQITAKCRPGHCSRCRQWLGMKESPSDVPTGAGTTSSFVANGIGELLATAANSTVTPSREHFLSNVRFCIDHLADGRRLRFSIATGVSFDALTDWFAPNRLFRLDLICRLCAALGISPLCFINERIDADDFDCDRARQVIRQRTGHLRHQWKMFQLRPVLEDAAKSGTVSLNQVAAELGYSSGHSLRRRDPDLCDRIVDNYRATHRKPWVAPYQAAYPTDEVIREALTHALLQPTPPPLKTVARELGFRSDASLYCRFPDLCRDFAKRNAISRQQRIDADRDRVLAALTETPPPTVEEVARRIGDCTASAIKHRFPDLYTKLVQKLPERKAILREQQRAILELALKEEPAPSMRAVAERTGRVVSCLRRIHPDLLKQIRKRHDELKVTLAQRRRAAFQAEIRATVIELIYLGIFPSRRRVLAHMKNPSMKGGKILDRQIRATLLELKAASGASVPDGHDSKPVPHG
jgi:hypothetical protein